jgi:DNA-binding beta-propeller fold protein YncE
VKPRPTARALSVLLAAVVGTGLVLVPSGAMGESTFTPQPAISLGDDTQPRDVTVLAGGTRALVVTDDGLVAVDITSATPAVTGTATNVFGSDVVGSSDGRTAYVANDDVLYVVDVTGDRPKLVRRITEAAPDDILDLAVRGKRLYASYGSGWPSGRGNGVRIFGLGNAHKPAKAGGFKTGSFPTGVAVSGDGKRVVTANDLVGSVTVADVSKRKPRVIEKELELPFDAGSVVTVGSTAYVYSDEDSRIARVSLGRARLGGTKTTMNGNEGGPMLAVSHDGAYLYTLLDQQGDDTTVAVLDRKRLSFVTGFTGVNFPRAVAASGSGPSKGSFFVVWASSAVYDTPAGFGGIARAG